MSRSNMYSDDNVSNQGARDGIYVSIVIPCRNEENFIGQCLDSIVLNDYPKEKLEVIIVDGLSEDRTREIITRYVKKYHFITLLDNPKRIIPTAMNIGIKSAKGKVIMKIDAHAFYQKDYISKCVHYLNEYNADNVGGTIITLPRRNTIVGKAIVFALSSSFGVGNSYFRIGSKQVIWADTVFSGCYKKEIFDLIGLYDESIARSEDININSRLKEKGGKILLVPEIVSYYYARSDLKSFWKHSLNNGLWAILPTMYTGRIVVSIRHLAPLAFVGSLFVFSMLSLITKTFLVPFLFVGGSYLLASIGFSTAAAFREKDIRFLFIMPVIFGTLHIGYGLGSLVGLVRVVVSKLFGAKL